MTTITINRAVVEQALEALESVYGDSCDALHALRAALAQQAEPVEPVAYIHRQGNHWEVSERHLDEDEKARGWTEEPLYTAPPQRKPLTEEEIIDATEHIDTSRNGYFIHIARAVERAHGITDPQVADSLARHGIQACLYPNCVGGQNGTVCHKHCPTPCPDCRGVGYDSSGQLCACQQNPSF